MPLRVMSLPSLYDVPLHRTLFTSFPGCLGPVHIIVAPNWGFRLILLQFLHDSIFSLFLLYSSAFILCYWQRFPSKSSTCIPCHWSKNIIDGVPDYRLKFVDLKATYSGYLRTNVTSRLVARLWPPKHSITNCTQFTERWRQMFSKLSKDMKADFIFVRDCKSYSQAFPLWNFWCFGLPSCIRWFLAPLMFHWMVFFLAHPNLQSHWVS